MLEPEVMRALARGHRIDVTTTGRRTGQPRRIELVFHNIGGRILISGRPGFPRSWLANLRANPHFTFHLTGPVKADLPATARVITERAERETLIRPIAELWGYDYRVMAAASPLVEVSFEELSSPLIPKPN